MQEYDYVMKLISLPMEFYRRGDISIHDLFKESNCFFLDKTISKDMLESAIREHPYCINEWLKYSADKRTKTGWYFKKIEQDYCVVGFLASNKESNIQLKFNDCIEGCAVFIQHEIKDIMNLQQR